MTIEEKQQHLEEWLIGRPPVIADLARRYPPWQWWQLTTDQPVPWTLYQVHSYSEDGTVTLVRWNAATREPMWRVFGINPRNLVAADDLETVAARLMPEEQAVGELAFAEQMAHLRARVAENN